MNTKDIEFGIQLTKMRHDQLIELVVDLYRALKSAQGFDVNQMPQQVLYLLAREDDRLKTIRNLRDYGVDFRDAKRIVQREENTLSNHKVYRKDGSLSKVETIRRIRSQTGLTMQEAKELFEEEFGY